MKIIDSFRSFRKNHQKMIEKTEDTVLIAILLFLGSQAFLAMFVPLGLEFPQWELDIVAMISNWF